MNPLILIESKIKMPLMELPVNSVLVSINEKRILISPGSKNQREQYLKEWNITDIIAPNLFHTAGIKKAYEQYPKANLWGPMGVEKKQPELPWNNIFFQTPWPFEEQLPCLLIGGMPSFNECVFIHVPTKTLIVTDLCFNLKNIEGFGARIILTMFGTYNNFGISRFFSTYIRDKKTFKASIEKLFSYDFENIIVGHGSVLTGNAKNLILKSLKARGLNP